jgi:hypothetical protein
MEDYKQKYLSLLLKVKSARQAQKNYYKERNAERKADFMAKAKDYERQLDREIEQHEQPQLPLS